jgi:glutathione S-transferase
MAPATLVISSKNDSSWSLRGWLMLVPRLEHDGVTVWDTLAIGEYLNETRPEAGRTSSASPDAVADLEVEL